MSTAARTLRITQTAGRFHVRLRRIPRRRRFPDSRGRHTNNSAIPQPCRCALPATAAANEPIRDHIQVGRRLRRQFVADAGKSVLHLLVETAAWCSLSQAGHQRRLGGVRWPVAQMAAEAVLHCAYSEIDQVGECQVHHRDGQINLIGSE